METKIIKGKYHPLNPVAFGAPVKSPNGGAPGQVSSGVVGDNSELISQVAALWIAPGDVVVDATYGRGVFWRNLPGLPTHAFDAMNGDDCKALPLGDSSVDVLVLDPPYRPTHGSKSFTNNLADAYQVGLDKLDTISDVLSLYEGGIKEAARVLRPGGRILVKCQDLSFSNRLHLASLDVLNYMVQYGFDLADQFVLVSKPRLTSTSWKNQERARRGHSILWVGSLA